MYKITMHSRPCALLDTVEGCRLYAHDRTLYALAQTAYDTFPSDVQRYMTFAPISGQIAERAQLWQAYLRTLYPPAVSAQVMCVILRGYVMKRRREEMTC